MKRRLIGMIARVGDVLEVLCLGRPVGFRVLEARRARERREGIQETKSLVG